MCTKINELLKSMYRLRMRRTTTTTTTQRNELLHSRDRTSAEVPRTPKLPRSQPDILLPLLGKLAHTSVGVDVRNDSAGSRGRGNVLASKVGEEVGIAGAEGAGATESVDDTGAAERCGARAAGRGAGDGEELTGLAGFDGEDDVLEDVALCEDVGTGSDLEGVARVLVPVVVDLI